tara:strand:- start:4050 stop:4862 length:813 start_codon:yes stop_codon:yes gene_type:complete
VKIAHEAPLSIFDEVQKVTDYDYALVHLFDESEEYYNKFVKAKEDGREIILDNSIFELGSAYNGDSYADWISKLEPDWYIVPDVLDDGDATVASFDNFVGTYAGLRGKVIAVAQGDNYNDFVNCYSYLSNNPCVDKVAISFDSKFFPPVVGENKWYRYMVGRQNMIAQLLEDGIINKNKPHHLLGCGLPQEFIAYQNYDWIDSVDTSNPVIHGLHDIKYQEDGLYAKYPTKLYTLMNENVVDKLEKVLYNIRIFRTFCNGVDDEEVDSAI